MDGFCYFGWHGLFFFIALMSNELLISVSLCILCWFGGPWLVPWISDDAEVYLGFQFEFDSFLSSCYLAILYVITGFSDCYF